MSSHIGLLNPCLTLTVGYLGEAHLAKRQALSQPIV
jgi:hypothetical protein